MRQLFSINKICQNFKSKQPRHSSFSFSLDNLEKNVQIFLALYFINGVLEQNLFDGVFFCDKPSVNCGRSAKQRYLLIEKHV